MPYAKKKVKIPLCTTCAEAYNAKADAVIVVVDYAKECIAHYVDLDTISCLKKIKDSDNIHIKKGPRAMTKAETRELFLDNIRGYVEYWENEDRRPKSIDKLNGLAFSILVMFDGESSLPAMDIIMRPHPDDKEYCIGKGENWIVDGMVINDDCHLHEHYYQEPEHEPTPADSDVPEKKEGD